MQRKLLIIFSIALAVVLIAGLVIFFLQRRTTTPTGNANTNAAALPNVNTVILNTNQAKNTNVALTNATQDPRTEVQQLASSFASIYASFSSQNDFTNITDLYFYMTPALKANQEQFVAQQRANPADTSVYHGITSVPRVINITAFDLNAGSATVAVTLQRVETSGSSSQTYNQDITLSFDRLQGAWKVGRIVWGTKQ